MSASCLAATAGVITVMCKLKKKSMGIEEAIKLIDFQTAVTKILMETKEEFPNLFSYDAGIVPEENENERYACSPLNTKVFCRTGGNGVHFSILELSRNIQPIVMTVPMNIGKSMNDYNKIIAENINEFLSIGYYNGWFHIEQLCYDNKWVIEFYSTENMDEEYKNDGDIQFVKKLRKHFNVNHKPLNNKRLKELEIKYFSDLVFSKSFVEKKVNKAST